MTIAWIAFTDADPPSVRALDNEKVISTKKILVTNNINAKDRMGQMSHVWLGRPIKDDKYGWIIFGDGGSVYFLTHWADPFTSETSPASGLELEAS